MLSSCKLNTSNFMEREVRVNFIVNINRNKSGNSRLVLSLTSSNTTSSVDGSFIDREGKLLVYLLLGEVLDLGVWVVCTISSILLQIVHTFSLTNPCSFNCPLSANCHL